MTGGDGETWTDSDAFSSSPLTIGVGSGMDLFFARMNSRTFSGSTTQLLTGGACTCTCACCVATSPLSPTSPVIPVSPSPLSPVSPVSPLRWEDLFRASCTLVRAFFKIDVGWLCVRASTPSSPCRVRESSVLARDGHLSASTATSPALCCREWLRDRE